MSVPEVGDRVRVVLEGVVTDGAQHGFEIGLTNRNWITPDAEHLVSVEILRPPVKVGDVIETAEELDALPYGAIVRSSMATAWQRFTDKWRSAEGERMHNPALPATVLYLPDGAA